MSTFGSIARRAIVEAALAEQKLTPEEVLELWAKPRYRDIIDSLLFSNINKTSDFAFTTTPMAQGVGGSIGNGNSLFATTSGQFDASLQGQFIRVSNDNVWYRIASVPDTTHLALDTAYAEDSKASASWTIAQRYYSITAPLRWIFDVKNPRRAFTLEEIAPAKMDDMFPNRVWGPSVPQWWSPYGYDDSGNRVIEIYPPSDVSYRLEVTGYSAIAEPMLTSSPHSDINERIIIEGVLADAFRYKAGALGVVSEESAPMRIAHSRSLLDIARSHETRYLELLDRQQRRDGIDAPQPRVRLAIQRQPSFGVLDPLTTAEDEVWSRSPRIGN